jgi:hypothetical protein
MWFAAAVGIGLNAFAVASNLRRSVPVPLLRSAITVVLAVVLAIGAVVSDASREVVVMLWGIAVVHVFQLGVAVGDHRSVQQDGRDGSSTAGPDGEAATASR